jgi:hypothetical protein
MKKLTVIQAHNLKGFRFAAILPLLTCCLWPSDAKALPVCQTGSFASYAALNQTGGCTVGDLIFFRFASPTPNVVGGLTPADLTQILVTPVITSQGDGLSFSSSGFFISSSSGLESVTYHLNYSVDPGPIIVGQTLELDPPYGNVTANQKYCVSDVLANNCALGLQFAQTVTPPSPVSVINYPYAAAFVDVQSDINLTATPGNPAGFDNLTTIEDIVPVSVAPEPTGVALLLCGLLVFAIAGRYSQRGFLKQLFQSSAK